MPRPASTRPTDSELEILNVLWRRGPSTLREVHDDLQSRRTTGLTTTLKTLQIMTEKGLVIRDAQGRPSRYTAAVKQQANRAGMLRDLIQKAFEGSAGKLLVQAVEEGGLSDQELREVRRLIDQVRKQKRGATR